MIRPQELRELFVPLVSLFEPVERDIHFPSEGIRDAWDFESLTFMLDDHWKIFAGNLDDEIRDRLMDDIWIRPGREAEGFHDTPPSEPWASRDDRIWDVSPEQTWRWFADAVKAGQWDEINNDESGDLVHPERWVDYSIRHRSAVRVITPRTVLYRGRPDPPLSHPGGPPIPWPHDQMHAPPAHLVTKGGRVNRAGESVFYAAYDLRTALCEAGREPGVLVSLRQVAATRRLRLADLTQFRGVTQPFGVEDLAAIDRHARLLHQLNIELSRRVEETDSDVDYLPTQVLAEAIRQAGYDGICFLSSRNQGGTNIVAFDPLDMRVFKRGKVAFVRSVPIDDATAIRNALE